MAKGKSAGGRKKSGASPHVPSPESLIRSKDLKERLEGIRILREQGDMETLLSLLYSESWYTREAAADALVALGPTVAEAVYPLLEEGYWYVRAAAFRILGHLASEKLLPHILKALKDNNVAVQLEAARAAVRLFQAHPDLKQHLSREERTEIEAILAHHKELDLLQHLQEHG